MSDIRVEATQTENDARVYTANFSLDSFGTWIVELDELPEVHSYGKTLGKAREYITDALALWLDIPVNEARDRLSYATPELPADVHEVVERALAERQIAESVAKVASEMMVEASLALVDGAHLSMRDAADVLGISHQRVQQLVSSRRGQEHVVLAPGPSQDLVDKFKEFLPGGAKQDLGLIAGLVTLGLAAAWIEYRSQS